MAWHVEGGGADRCAVPQCTRAPTPAKERSWGGSRRKEACVKSVVAWRAYSDVECMTNTKR